MILFNLKYSKYFQNIGKGTGKVKVNIKIFCVLFKIRDSDVIKVIA